MMDFVTTAETFLQLSIPVLAVLTVFTWGLAHSRWPYRLPLVIALAATLNGACASWLAFASYYRDNVGPLPEAWSILTALSVLGLVFAFWLPVMFLVYLDLR